MDDKSAEKLVKETFGTNFNENKFIEFLNELFNGIEFNKQNISKFMGKGFSDYINSIYSLGQYTDSSHNSIEFYTVDLKKTSSRDRARTMQRNLIAKNLKNRGKQAGIVAFYGEESEDWRFSFVKFEYEFTKGFNLKEKLTPAKRHSFLVGPDEPNHTCLSSFKDLLIIEDDISLKQIEQAFSVENVTDEFFEEYKNLFLKLEKSLKNVVKTDEKVKNELSSKNINCGDFAKKLLGQLVFIYFLQKKGWLGVKSKDNFGSGPRDFLRKLYNKEFIDYDNFFNDVLEELFYKGLSEDVDDYHYNKFNFKVPFLNGGLFEPINQYNWKQTDIILKNEIFEEILDTFDLFNFTVIEDQPLEKEVAVDPEMLGKVLEKLSNDRREEGKYYTPREIVHYMCQQTLISYLDTNTDLNHDDIKEFIENGDLAIDSIFTRQEEAEKYNGKIYTPLNLAESIKNHSKELENLLRNVKVVDPAVGSGAFPVGMMNELVKAISILQLINNDPVDIYELKREIIENSLYGVDKDLSATDITKLRFWLSLIVDEESIDDIHPLPNLDNQILCGNSLINTFEGVQLFDDLIDNNPQTTLFAKSSEVKFKQLEKKKTKFFSTESINTKKELRVKIENLKWEIIEDYLKETNNKSKIAKIKNYKNNPEKPFLLWNLEFSEVFRGNNPGFDIVIGNPPYVQEKLNNDTLSILKKSPYHKGKMNIWYFFGCVALDIAKNDGVVSFIAPNNWITNSGASIFRNKVNREAELEFYIDFGDYKVFDAGIQTMIYLMKKNQKKKSYSVDYSVLIDKNIDNNQLIAFLYDANNNEFYKKFKTGFNREINQNEYFRFLKKEIYNILENINKNCFYLDDAEIIQGIAPNPDKINSRNISKISKANIEKYNIKQGDGVFVIPKNYFHDLTDIEKTFIKPLYEPNDCEKFYFPNNYEKEIIYLSKENTSKMDLDQIPNIISHLKKYREIMDDRRENKNNAREYYHLHWPRDESFFKKGQKVLSVRKCSKPTFIFTEEESYVMLSFNIIKTDRIDLKVLTSILNSNLIQFWLKYMGKLQGFQFQIDKEPLLKIPIIKDIPEDVKDELIKNVDSLLNNKNSNINMDNINNLIYGLYGLNSNEIIFIEKQFNEN
ncbi:MAG: Eco57I restriction-modification methylase domain-containing protein [Methanobrevibacter sp.]|jgi:hypothetical protein|nr:Eco57I restriction-modification methylase domain-containing protein [Candidatus Methanoflexus mossambicus]